MRHQPIVWALWTKFWFQINYWMSRDTFYFCSKTKCDLDHKKYLEGLQKLSSFEFPLDSKRFCSISSIEMGREANHAYQTSQSFFSMTKNVPIHIFQYFETKSYVWMTPNSFHSQISFYLCNFMDLFTKVTIYSII